MIMKMDDQICVRKEEARKRQETRNQEERGKQEVSKRNGRIEEEERKMKQSRNKEGKAHRKGQEERVCCLGLLLEQSKRGIATV